MFWKLIKTLRPKVIVIILISWNVLIGIAIAFNGGIGQIRTLPSAIAMACTCGSLAVFGFCTALMPSWQRVMLRPEADPKYAQPGLLFVALIGIILTVAGVFTATGIIGKHT